MLKLKRRTTYKGEWWTHKFLDKLEEEMLKEEEEEDIHSLTNLFIAYAISNNLRIVYARGDRDLVRPGAPEVQAGNVQCQVVVGCPRGREESGAGARGGREDAQQSDLMGKEAVPFSPAARQWSQGLRRESSRSCGAKG